MKNGIKQQPPIHPIQTSARLANQAISRYFVCTRVRTRVSQDGQMTRSGLSSLKLANWRGSVKLPRVMVQHTLANYWRFGSIKVNLICGLAELEGP